ncbi:hypothetical protein [Aminobacter carboxidus]|uniref:Uncharacterized protein n=1 Tax=Aminobacter carboxidus TaxID=376165 RepID=A0ABR9GGN1_9HYPH|nr:hypothetical protein [Aminobacter carboxidus]MBE1202804.1 hypothetical protein [Aminobacter carboxidus]
MKHLIRLSLGAAIAIAAMAGGTFAQMHGPLMFQGHEMMSADDMTKMIDRMHNAKTEAECGAIRAEHWQLMQKRAEEMGIKLPTEHKWENMPLGCGPGMMGGSGVPGTQNNDSTAK